MLNNIRELGVKRTLTWEAILALAYIVDVVNIMLPEQVQNDKQSAASSHCRLTSLRYFSASLCLRLSSSEISTIPPVDMHAPMIS